jgi:hypothetical protein
VYIRPALKPVIYSGSGDITMAGSWKAVIAVKQEDKALARKTMTLRVA